jgi:hypothetical protein
MKKAAGIMIQPKNQPLGSFYCLQLVANKSVTFAIMMNSDSFILIRRGMPHSLTIARGI